MTREQVDNTMNHHKSYREAFKAAKNRFASEMESRMYGPDEMFNAWYWFYTGWIDGQLNKDKS